MKMNVIITQYKKAVLLAVAVVAMSISSAAFAKCDSCEAAAAIKKSIKDAHAALIAAGKKVSREMELEEINPADVSIVEACCAYCAEHGAYCGGENSVRCNACQAGLFKVSIEEAAAALAAVNKKSELDVVFSSASRAPREALDDPCNTGQTVVDCVTVCGLNCKLKALFECCVNTNQNVICQAREAEKCCKKVRRDIDKVDDRVKDCCEDLDDRIKECCEDLKECIGDLDGSSIPIPPCSQQFSIVDVINNTDIDVISWLKSLYVLLFQVYQCTCQPCNG